MLRRTLTSTIAAIALAVPALGYSVTPAAAAGGLMTIIVNDPSNPYWQTEGNVAKAEAEKLGYTANVGASKGDTNTESNLIDTAITNHSVAIILDPANASGSVGAVKKAIAANIPVILVNAEINQEGLAKAQLVSNNAQGAALGAQQWVKDVGQTGNYVRAARRAVRQQRRHPVERLQHRAQPVFRPQEGRGRRSRTGTGPRATTRCRTCSRANPNIIGVISGNDEMALGAIAALKEAGKLSSIKVGGFDGSPDAGGGGHVGASWPIPCSSRSPPRREGGGRGGLVHQDRQDRRGDGEAAVQLHSRHQGQRRALRRAVHARQVG